jgi:ABC-type uncharacterized transport system permease subunit
LRTVIAGFASLSNGGARNASLGGWLLEEVLMILFVLDFLVGVKHGVLEEQHWT